MMKLSEYALKHNVTYRTAWNRYKAGKIPNTVFEDGRIRIQEENIIDFNKCAIYSRVSNNDAKENLKRQSDRIEQFAICNGYQIVENVSEIGSGLNDNRSKLIKLLKSDKWNTLIVENKDRLTRFGFNYIKTLLEANNKRLIVINVSNDDKSDIIQDLISIIYSFSARIYGLRRAKHIKDAAKKIIT